MAMRKGGAKFKRRSAMKMLHHVSSLTPSPVVINTAGVAGTVITYVNVARYLSQKLGRNMSQAMTYRLVGFRVMLVNLADAASDIGASVAMQLRTVSPSRGRVAAHEAIMKEYVQDVRDDNAWSRGRQLFVAYDSIQPIDLAESVLLRNDVPNRVHLLGASGAGNIGVFADYTTRFPKPEGTAATVAQPDQDLYGEFASQTEDTINGHATLYSAWHEDIELPVDVPTAYGPWNGPLTIFDWEWWAPSGTYIPMMCGMGKFIMADSVFPVLQSGPGGVVSAVTPTRGALSAIFDLWVEGWTPLSSK